MNKRRLRIGERGSRSLADGTRIRVRHIFSTDVQPQKSLTLWASCGSSWGSLPVNETVMSQVINHIRGVALRDNVSKPRVRESTTAGPDDPLGAMEATVKRRLRPSYGTSKTCRLVIYFRPTRIIGHEGRVRVGRREEEKIATDQDIPGEEGVTSLVLSVHGSGWTRWVKVTLRQRVFPLNVRSQLLELCAQKVFLMGVYQKLHQRGERYGRFDRIPTGPSTSRSSKQ